MWLMCIVHVRCSALLQHIAVLHFFLFFFFTFIQLHAPQYTATLLQHTVTHCVAIKCMYTHQQMHTCGSGITMTHKPAFRFFFVQVAYLQFCIPLILAVVQIDQITNTEIFVIY